MARVLIVDDEPELRNSISIGLAEGGHEVETAACAAEALAAVADHAQFDIVILDLGLPDRDGLEVLSELREKHADMPVIVVSADGAMASMVSAMRDGAFDYLSKPLGPEQLERRITQALRLTSHPPGQVPLPVDAEDRTPDELVGTSPAIREVFKMLGLLSASRTTVLIRGESGTGKELAARILHRFGRGSAREPFVAVSCAALPSNLVEAEIFGYRRGAFTGAERDHPGKLEAADGGTLFLDEIGDVPLETQVKLLRVLQERTFERLGETTSRPFTARVVAATHRDLEALVREGRFREDLYYRLNVATIALPPLRGRREDVPALAEHLVRAVSSEVGRTVGLSPAALLRLRAHDWPGNVRELRNVLTRAAVRCRGSAIQEDDLELGEHGSTTPATSMTRPAAAAMPAVATPALPAAAAGAPEAAAGEERFPSLDEVERAHVLRALTITRGHKGRACALLGISRPTLLRKIRRYGLA